MAQGDSKVIESTRRTQISRNTVKSLPSPDGRSILGHHWSPYYGRADHLEGASTLTFSPVPRRSSRLTTF